MDKSSTREICKNATCVGSRRTGGNRVRVPIALVFLLSVLAACAGTMSGTGDSGEILVYAVSEDTAFQIIRDSMLPVVREGTTVRADSPHKGYTGTVKLGLDKGPYHCRDDPGEGAQFCWHRARRISVRRDPQRHRGGR